MERRSYSITGRVQGVGYRAFARTVARGLGLAGWVSNRPDGSVEVLAEGTPRALANLEARLREGPPGAVVTAVARGDAAGEERFSPGDFEIRFG
ncbi:MAG: acylphosphatase [Candidatus Krumholzibacteriia bacterium]|nr:acylphosphatase [Candidatus Latescibacterota bacterium]MCB9515373.1 acylphosphatase [Candidatus Latescibacterota bacterium]